MEPVSVCAISQKINLRGRLAVFIIQRINFMVRIICVLLTADLQTKKVECGHGTHLYIAFAMVAKQEFFGKHLFF